MGRDSFHCPVEYRLRVLARAMDGYVRQQFTTGVSQNNFVGRNVMLLLAPAPATAANNAGSSCTSEGAHEAGEGPADMVCGLAMSSRIVLLDYNHSTVSHLPELPQPQVAEDVGFATETTRSTSELPTNPAEIFWVPWLWEDFTGWMPNEWHDGEQQHRWLLKEFVGEKR